jgi:predicted transcriptional regulator
LHRIEDVTIKPNPGDDEVLHALDGLVETLNNNIAASETVVKRAGLIREMRDRGLAYREIADAIGEPLIIQLATDNLDRLRLSGAQLRQAQAAALYDEGLTMEQIANLFGVSRQRVSALLRANRGGNPQAPTISEE